MADSNTGLSGALGRATEAARLANKLGAQRRGAEWVTTCLSHRDTDPSLSFRQGDRGLVATCRAGCPADKVFAALREAHPDVLCPERGRGKFSPSTPPDVNSTQPPAAAKALVSTTRYEVRNTAGTLIATHLRHDYDDGSKSMPWEKSDGTTGLGHPAAVLPFFGSERLAGAKTVIVVEGEKAAAALQEILVDKGGETVAVGTVTGASGTPCSETLATLKGKKVFLWPDNDSPGFEHMVRISAALGGVASTVLPPSDKPAGWDAADAVGEWDFDLDAFLKSASPPVPTTTKSKKIDERPTLAGRLTSLGELKRQASEWEADPKRWLVDGIIPNRGVLGIIGGSPKVGKSTFAIDLMRAVSEGSEFMGLKALEARVLYIAAEDPGFYIGHQFGHFGAEKEIAILNDVFVVSDESMAELGDLIHDQGIGFVYIATLMNLLVAGGGEDENENAKMAKIVTAFKDLARKVGIPILVEHHTNKAASRPGADPSNLAVAMRGASSIGAHADFLMTLDHDGVSMGNARLFKVAGRAVESKSMRVGLEMGDRWSFSVLAESISEDAKNTDRQIFASLVGVSPLSTHSLMQIAGWSTKIKDRVRRANAALGSLDGVKRETVRNKFYWSMPLTKEEQEIREGNWGEDP